MIDLSPYNCKIFTNEIEDTAFQQIQELLRHPAFDSAKVRIMPDCHAGKGCVIGFTADLGDKVVPNLVGVDIGCGMLAIPIYAPALAVDDLSRLDRVIQTTVPVGMNVQNEPSRTAREYIESLRCCKQLKNIDHLEKSLGTLGSGNHFIEIDLDPDDHYWLIIHSGSRNLGKQVCEIYQNRAIELQRAGEITSRNILRNSIIQSLKLNGRQSEIQEELKKFDENWEKDQLPDDLCYLCALDRDDYLHDMEICQKFAFKSRVNIAEIIFQEMGWEMKSSGMTTIHNYIDLEKNIIRKGAVSAEKGEHFLIPLSMKDGTLFCEGKGNPDWNWSAPHGAGRRMSRSAAFKNLSLREFERQMGEIYSSCINEKTLDESPMAYKDPLNIIENISDTANIIGYMKPVYNYKAQ